MISCPDCWPAQQARTLVWHHHFWENLVAALLPFAVVALVSWVICRRLEQAERQLGKAP